MRKGMREGGREGRREGGRGGDRMLYDGIVLCTVGALPSRIVLLHAHTCTSVCCTYTLTHTSTHVHTHTIHDMTYILHTHAHTHTSHTLTCAHRWRVTFRNRWWTKHSSWPRRLQLSSKERTIQMPRLRQRR